MGLLTLFNKRETNLLRLPSGSFTVDRNGEVVVRTIPSSFPAEILVDVAAKVLAAFRQGADAQLPLNDLIISYPSLRIAARELRGGAIIFLSPQYPYNS